VKSADYYRKLSGPAWSALGLVLLLVGWEVISRHYSGLAIASPIATFRALGELLARRDFLEGHLLISLARTALGLSLGFGAGLALGALAGVLSPVQRILAPLRRMLMSVPGVVVVMLAMLWFGMGGTMVVAIVTAMIAPVVYVSVVEGLDAVDRGHLEMARVYRLPTGMRLYRIYGMAMAGPLISGGLVALGSAIRLVVLAEALGAGEGLGYALALARTNLETPQLYALALLCISIVAGVELAVLGPVRHRVLRRGGRPSADWAAPEEFVRPAGNPPPSEASPAEGWLPRPPRTGAEEGGGPLVRLLGVHKSFQGREVLRGISLEVRRGEIVGVLGPSGVGKSTLLRLIAGLERPTRGRVEVVAARIGYVFQEPRLLPWCTAGENVALPLMAFGLRKAPALALAREFLMAMELGGREDAFPGELSGGMRQRVSLARALAVGPDLLLLDEPFTGLDPALRGNMLGLIDAAVVQSRAAVIEVTHDREELPAATGRIVYLDGERGLVSVPGPGDRKKKPRGEDGRLK
jgi:NitT/TauT family transport system permease protein